jgi:translation initiation factor IF-3
MELTGKIKVLKETQNIGSNGFRKREVVITTEDQYPQDILVEFIQDKCDLLNKYAIGQEVKININLRGREWINSEGVAKYFNAIQGWRIEILKSQDPIEDEIPDIPPVNFIDEDGTNNDLPF